MKKISVVISAFNESAKIEKTLKAVVWADEIIVVDNESTDDTAAIAKKSGAAVFTRKNDLMLNRNKNFGFIKATGAWILNLDADEVVPPELAAEIKTIVAVPDAGPQAPVGYWLSRKNIIFGKWVSHGLWWPDKQLRLFRRDKGRFPEKHIHEYLAVDGPVGELKNPLLHFNYETISQYLAKLDRCTTSEAGYLVDSDYQFSWSDALRFPVSDFVKIYFAQKAYRDGLHGLVLALLQAFYAFIVFTKVWEKRDFKEVEISQKSLNREFLAERQTIGHWLYMTEVSETRQPAAVLLIKIRKRLMSFLGRLGW